MTETAVLQALFLYLPYVVALVLAFLARSATARGMVAVIATFMLSAFIVLPILTQGCTHDNFAYRDCPRIGPAVAAVLSVAELSLVAAHLFLMPLLALVAAVLEWRARRHG